MNLLSLFLNRQFCFSFLISFLFANAICFKQHSAGLRNSPNTKEGGKEDVRYVISKLPNHFELLGLIHKLFPGAPILHTTRDVRDTLLSNYQMAYQQVNERSASGRAFFLVISSFWYGHVVQLFTFCSSSFELPLQFFFLNQPAGGDNAGTTLRCHI